MKRTIVTYAVLLSIVSGFTFASNVRAANVPVSIQEVATQVKARNYTVFQEAERVYQARQSIRVARAELLPKLNLWRWVSVIVDWKSFAGVLEDLVPFLVPNNWLRLKQQELFYQAEVQGYVALRANEVFNAKSLYYQAFSDISLLEHLKKSLSMTQDVLGFVKTQELFGQVPQGTAKKLEIRSLSLDDDIRSLEILVYRERQALSVMMGMASPQLMDIVPMNYPELSTQPPVHLDPIMNVGVAAAPELKQYDYLLRAANSVRKEAYFSVLGISSLSRGTAGGIFDAYPVQDGLGFGLGPALKISKSQKKMIAIAQQASSETLKRQIDLVVESYNLALMRYQNVKKRLDMSQELYASLEEKLRIGSDVSGLELIDASEQVINARVDYLGIMTDFLQQDEKIRRIQFVDDYQK